jgi:hypothetical protein
MHSYVGVRSEFVVSDNEIVSYPICPRCFAVSGLVPSFVSAFDAAEGQASNRKVCLEGNTRPSKSPCDLSDQASQSYV